MIDISIPVAFVAGLVSFLAPCVLPIVPGFLSYLAGSAANGQRPSRSAVFINALFFVLGFSVVFALLGVALNTVLERVAYDAQIWLARVGGAIVIFFGLYLTGLIKIGFLEREHKIAIGGREGKSRYITSFLFGLAFAAGWTPCVGAALGVILGLAAAEPARAFYLLLSYALGLGLPFLAVGLFVSQASGILVKFAGIVKYVNMIFGLILIGLGVLIFTMQLSRIANFEFLNQILLQ